MNLEGIEIVALKLFLAVVVGLILGLEREAKHKPLGLKTCVVISIASCLLTMVSIEFTQNSYKGTLFTGADPMRLPAQIVSGVGFLGAGVILRRDNNIIYGLTTAAIVWTVSGLGIAIGLGYYLEAAISTGLIYITLRILPFIVRKIGPRSLKEQEVILRVHIDSDVLIASVVEKIEVYVNSTENVKIRGDADGHWIDMRCFIDDKKGSIFNKYDKIIQISGVNQMEIMKV